MDEEGTRAALQTISGSMNFFGKVGDAVDWLGNCQDALEWVIDCANFVRVVEAYQDLSDEYVASLRQVASQMSGSTAYTAAFRSALDEYDSWLSQEVIAAAAIEHGVKGFAKLTADALSPFTQMVMLDYCTSALGRSGRGSHRRLQPGLVPQQHPHRQRQGGGKPGDHPGHLLRGENAL